MKPKVLFFVSIVPSCPSCMAVGSYSERRRNSDWRYAIAIQYTPSAIDAPAISSAAD
jgi:hypothetical protein